MKNNDTSLNGGNQELQNQNGVVPNLENENNVNSGENNTISEISLGNLNSAETTNLGENNSIVNQVGMDFSKEPNIENMESLNATDNNMNDSNSQNGMVNPVNDNPFLVNQPATDVLNVEVPSNTADFNANSSNQNVSVGNDTMNSNSNPSTVEQMDPNPTIVTPFGENQNNNMASNPETNLNANSPANQMNFNTPVVDNPFLNNSSDMMNNGNANTGNNSQNPNVVPNITGAIQGANPENNNIIKAVPTPPSMVDFPVSNDNKKEKKGLSKTTIIIIAIVLVFLIGAGIYFILNLAGNKKTTGSITPKTELVMELGRPLSSNVNDYATIQGLDVSSCNIDFSEVDIHKIGAYSYKITCGSISRTGEVIIKDTSAPNIAVKELKVIPGSKVTLDDFVVSCSDVSNCSYELEDSSILLDTLVASLGEHKLNLVVSDDYDNQKIVELTLIVDANAPVKFMHCTTSTKPDEELHANVDVTYTYGIDNNDQLVASEKKSEYIFDVEEDYLNAKAKQDTNSENQNVSFDDSEFVITIIENIEDLSKEFNVSTFPTDYLDLKQFQLDQGFTCKNR